MEKIKVTDKKESPETGDKTVSIISIADLQERVRMGESLPQDDSFFDAEKGSSLGYFNREEITGLTGLLSGDEKSYPIVEIDGKIVGLAELEKDKKTNDRYSIKFISINSGFQGKGYAKDLIEKIFEFAKENDYSLQMSSYEEIEGDGTMLKKTIERTAEDTGVKIFYTSDESTD